MANADPMDVGLVLFEGVPVLFAVAKASSARALATRCPMSAFCGLGPSAFGSNENLLPFECSMEKSSRAGKREVTSSNDGSMRAGPFVSSAVNGSGPVGLKGDGLGFAIFESPPAFVGRPLRIGVISGISAFSLVGAARIAPIEGGEEI